MAQTEIQHLREMLRMQGARIWEFEVSILEQHEWTNAFQNQVQEVNVCLVRMVREVRDWWRTF